MNPLLQSVQLALQNATQTEALAYIDKVTDFCIEQENGRVLDGWPRDMIQLLIAYHMAKDTIYVEHGSDGKVLGLLMWYECDEDADWFFIQNWAADDKGGNAVFAAFMFAKTTEAFKEITRNFIIKCPAVMYKKILTIRHKSGVPTRVEYTTKIFDKILTK